MSLKVAVNGAAGKMGRRLVALVLREPDAEIVSASDRKGHPELGRDVGELAGAGPVRVHLTHDIQGEPEVIIDFSSPEGAAKSAKAAAELGVPLVTGTTGLGAREKAEIESAAGRVPVLAAPNFSVGVNLMFEITRTVAETLGPGYDVEIIEAHHNQKADAPSGTALRLAKMVADVLKRDPKKDYVHGREGRVGPRKPTEIGLHAVRAGDIVGEHTVIFGGMGERIELVHRAHTRDTFVGGAMRAAQWIIGKAPGKYSMDQVLGLD